MFRFQEAQTAVLFYSSRIAHTPGRTNNFKKLCFAVLKTKFLGE